MGHGNLTCPTISGENNYNDAGRTGPRVRLRLDGSYLEYRHCVCNQGMEVCSCREYFNKYEKRKYLRVWFVKQIPFQEGVLSKNTSCANPIKASTSSVDIAVSLIHSIYQILFGN